MLFPADFDAKKKRKVAEIYQALNSDPIDVAALRRMAISEGGLLTDEIRCKVWPKLLSVNTDDLPPLPGTEQPGRAWRLCLAFPLCTFPSPSPRGKGICAAERAPRPHTLRVLPERQSRKRAAS